MFNFKPTALWDALCQLRFLGRAAALGSTLAVVWLLTLPLALARSGLDGLLASLTAFLVCLFGGEAGLLIGSFSGGPLAAMKASAVRVVLVLGVGIALQVSVHRLASAGFVFYLLAYYLVGLVPETLLFLADASRESKINRAA
jgi:hypothetical protein